ncbi:MAG: metallophosphoesterase [Cryomorphaceae bacterium]|nr:metallophosphoesterase [Cryomorphaceae bacterium]
MTYILRSVFTILLLIAIDYYAYQAWKVITRNHPGFRWIFWAGTVLVFALMLAALVMVVNGTRNSTLFNYMVIASLTLYVPKLLVCGFMFGEDVWRFFEGTWQYFAGQKSSGFMPSRRLFVSQLALGVASIPFLSIIYGAWKGKYRFRVERQELAFEDLPEAFDGFTIAQISDLHTGSFDSKEAVLEGLEMMNAENPDVVLFTGDIVNNAADELDGWGSIYQKIQAKIGKFSVLGNHDYGDYMVWPSAQAKRDNLKDLCDFQHDIGFQLLRNEAVELKRGTASIFIAGVENWGKPPFPQYGDLSEALREVPKDGFTLLMSHDPSHFDEQIKQYDNKAHITFSGHTHGMQFGVEIPGWIKWSPVKFRYPKWAGLYSENDRYLYVNRGFGHIGYHGRVGIWPEITMITLRKKPKQA